MLIVLILYGKNFGGKKLGQKSCCKGLAKKTLVNVDLHCQSSINGKMKPNEAIPNIDETHSVFSRICLAPHANSVLFDDGEGYVYILYMTVESMIHDYQAIYHLKVNWTF